MRTILLLMIFSCVTLANIFANNTNGLTNAQNTMISGDAERVSCNVTFVNNTNCAIALKIPNSQSVTYLTPPGYGYNKVSFKDFSAFYDGIDSLSVGVANSLGTSNYDGIPVSNYQQMHAPYFDTYQLVVIFKCRNNFYEPPYLPGGISGLYYKNGGDKVKSLNISISLDHGCSKPAFTITFNGKFPSLLPYERKKAKC